MTRPKLKAEKVTCPYCNHPAVYVDSREVYGRSYGKVYLCKPCDAYVGVHRGTTKPKGSLANRELRLWRMMAHEAFDSLWAVGVPFNRNGAYQWLAAKLGVDREECHIGMFDVAMCQKVVAACKDFKAAAREASA